MQGVYTGKELAEYNMYINFSNNLIGEFLKTKENYFANYSDAGLNYVTPDTTKEIFIPNVDQTHQSINDIKEMLQKKATLPLKKTAQSLIPEVKGEIEILEEMADYYETKEYTKDDFRKAKKLHDSLLKTTKKTNSDIASFNKEVDKLMEEQHLAKMAELKNNGDTVTYS
ncbi:YiiG family protein, partial [Listeria welshimeri]|nr:YiiG family protein [Listeria welshimeri]